jgi:hypothetical protein
VNNNPIYDDRLVTRSILPIGSNSTTKTWGYHAVAWRGTSNIGNVYDACLKVFDSTTNTWILPTNMIFTNYSNLLAISSVNLEGFYNQYFITTPINRID